MVISRDQIYFYEYFTDLFQVLLRPKILFMSLENHIPVDTKYYLKNQLSKLLIRIFGPILGEKVASLRALHPASEFRCIAVLSVF